MFEGQRFAILVMFYFTLASVTFKRHKSYMALSKKKKCLFAGSVISLSFLQSLSDKKKVVLGRDKIRYLQKKSPTIYCKMLAPSLAMPH